MSKQRLIGIIVAVIVIALGIGACSIQKQEKSKEFTGTREAVTLGFAPSLNYLTIIALEQGFFSSEGLDVTVIEYPTGKRVLKDGLLAGEVDVGVVGLGPLAFESFEREDFRLFGSVATFFDLYRIVARKDQGILQPSDLRGKHLATSKASSFHYFLHNFLIENSLSKEDIQLSFKKAAELPDALVSGEIDAFSSREPFVSEAENSLGDNAIVFAEPDLPANTLNLVALDSFIQDRPQAIEKILRALIQAEDFAKEYPNQTIEIVANKLEVEESQLADRWSKVDLRVSLAQELVLSLENIARWAIRGSLTDKNQVPNYLDYIHLSGLEAVKTEAVTIIR